MDYAKYRYLIFICILVRTININVYVHRPPSGSLVPLLVMTYDDSCYGLCYDLWLFISLSDFLEQMPGIRDFDNENDKPLEGRRRTLSSERLHVNIQVW